MAKNEMGETSIINYGKMKVLGSTMEQGKLYSKHPDIDSPYYRDNEPRYTFIKTCLVGHTKLRIIDLGCNAGQFLFNFVKDDICKKGFGYDYDGEAIDIARVLKKKLDYPLYFDKLDLNEFDWGLLPSADVIFFLSTFQYVYTKQTREKSVQLLQTLAQKSEYLFFELPGNDSVSPIPEAVSLDWQLQLLKDGHWRPESWELFDCETGTARYMIFAKSIIKIIGKSRHLKSGQQAELYLTEDQQFVIKKYQKWTNNEHKILPLLKDEHIICSDSAYTINNMPVLFLKYEQGKDLILGDVSSKSTRDQLLYIKQYLKEKRVIHHDINLFNFIITKTGKVILLDFGWAETPEFPLNHEIPSTLNDGVFDDETAFNTILGDTI